MAQEQVAEKKCEMKCGIIWVDGVPISIFLARLEEEAEYKSLGCVKRDDIEKLAKEYCCVIATDGQGWCRGDEEEVYIADDRDCAVVEQVYNELEREG